MNVRQTINHCRNRKDGRKMAAIQLTSETFQKEVLEAKEPVLVDFWAPWCGPCQMVLPIIEELAEEVTDVKICKVNVDEQMKIAKEYRVMSIHHSLGAESHRRMPFPCKQESNIPPLKLFRQKSRS